MFRITDPYTVLQNRSNAKCKIQQNYINILPTVAVKNVMKLTGMPLGQHRI
jgi:hypothetical protein